jgi:hypothetical protein
MITEKSIFTLEIPEWVSKVMYWYSSSFLYQKGGSPLKHEGATLRKVGTKEYYR